LKESKQLHLEIILPLLHVVHHIMLL